MSTLFPGSLTPALDSSGEPINGAEWRFFRTGTTTPLRVTNGEGTSLGTTITSDAAGRFPNAYLDDGYVYRAQLHPSAASTTATRDVDPVNPIGDAASVLAFGATGDGTTDDYDAIVDAWEYCLDNGKDLYFPAGTYNTYAASFPFRQEGSPSDLLDCGGISVYGDGSSTIFKTQTVGIGADVLQLNGLKNFHVRNIKLTSSRTGGGTEGSNGISVTGGWDNITLLDIECENLPSVDRTTLVDGGKALTLQSDTTGNECGSLVARIRARGCAEGFGAEFTMPNCFAKRTNVRVDVQAEDCYTAVKVVSGEAGSAVSAGDTMGLVIRAQAVDCQSDVVLNRAHGVDIECQVNTTKTEAARRLSPASVAWFAPDPTVVSAVIKYAKNSRVRVTGFKGACKHKVELGGTTAGSSGLGGDTEGCDLYFDIGGTASTSNFLVASSGSDTVSNSTVRATTDTASEIPADFYGLAKSNDCKIIGEGAYEEGTYTPVFNNSGGGATVTFAIAEAKYVRVGKHVTVCIIATRTDATAHAGSVTFTLPFPSESANWRPVGTWMFAAGNVHGLLVTDNYADDLVNCVYTSATPGTDLTYSGLADGTRFSATFTYLAG